MATTAEGNWTLRRSAIWGGAEIVDSSSQQHIASFEPAWNGDGVLRFADGQTLLVALKGLCRPVWTMTTESGQQVLSLRRREHTVDLFSGSSVSQTCLGNDKNLPIRQWSNPNGPFLQDLAAAGFSRESVDTVLCTHLHMDHVGWNTTLVGGKRAPTFPRARYLFGRIEWEHWSRSTESRMKPVIEQSIQPILDASLNTLVETDHGITDEVWLEPTPRHTPGHCRQLSRGGILSRATHKEVIL